MDIQQFRDIEIGTPVIVSMEREWHDPEVFERL
jgi:hypothetical protein